MYAPRAWAWEAFWWDEAAKESCRSREMEKVEATFSEVTPIGVMMSEESFSDAESPSSMSGPSPKLH